jgi:SAM-dependent methyltransferase
MNILQLKEFYASRLGWYVKKCLNKRVIEKWPLDRSHPSHILTDKDIVMLGYGYAVPYLKKYLAEGVNVLALMPSFQGADQWPKFSSKPSGNRTVMCDEDHFPLSTNSVDYILAIHALEHAHHVEDMLKELSRVLKSGGEMILIVPYRAGLWARFDHTVFGHGRPYSLFQLRQLLREHMFAIKSVERALYIPPLRFKPVLRLGLMLERVKFLRFCLGGVMMVHVTKQIYAGVVLAPQKDKKTKQIIKPAAITARQHHS